MFPPPPTPPESSRSMLSGLSLVMIPASRIYDRRQGRGLKPMGRARRSAGTATKLINRATPHDLSILFFDSFLVKNPDLGIRCKW